MSASASSTSTTASHIRITASNFVNVREQASADSARVGRAQSGGMYPCFGIAENGWYLIQLDDGATGHVSNQYAEPVAGE